jgi:hypothetical protein
VSVTPWHPLPTQLGTHAPSKPWLGSQTAFAPVQLELLPQPHTPGPPSRKQLGAAAGQAWSVAQVQTPLAQVWLPGQSLATLH